MKTHNTNIAYMFDDANIFSKENVYPELHNVEFKVPHFHTYYEIVLMLKGSIKHNYYVFAKDAKINLKTNKLSQKYTHLDSEYSSESLEAGDIQIISPEVCHYYKFTNPQSEYINIAISSNMFNQLVKTLNSNKFDNLPLKVNLPPDKIDQLKTEFFEAEENKSLSEKDKGALNKILALNCMRAFIANTEKSNNVLPQWMRELTILLNNPNYYSFTIEEIIASIPYSHSYICKEFKKVFGVSLKNYFTKKKMKHACYLLQNTELKIITISNALGYSNQGFFANVFFKQFAVTPFDYRKSFSSHHPKETDA